MYQYTLKIQNDRGELYELTHDNDNYVIEDAEGFEPVSVNINTHKAAGDGSFFDSAQAQERNIVLHLVITGDTKEKITENRIKLYRIFSLKKPITLFFKNTHRNVKIQCYAETITPDIHAPVERAVISLLCPSPWFEEVPEDGDGQSASTPSAVTEMFEFPFAIEVGEPAVLSEAVYEEKEDDPLTDSCRVDNSGDIECGCVIKLSIQSGYLPQVVIFNASTGDKFVIDHSLYPGQTITIDTRPGKLSAVMKYKTGAELNLLGYIDKGSSWFKLPQGSNYFWVSKQGTPGKLEMSVEITRLYGGV